MMLHLSLGVIGHVDHGKTSLVKALSGIDTDRLKEEKERGMSIVLGFAHLRFDEGVIELIDVPGHENFIRTMVSGATGIHAALLVVDAREGVKPQTIEHLAITGLLGIRRGVIAITRSDLADEDSKASVLKQIRTTVNGTYLEYAPRVFTSARTGEGVAELALALQHLLQNTTPAPFASQFWLPVDRVFSIPGRGTVVTGTMRMGSLKVGQEVELMPQGRRVAVRQIEAHGREVEEVRAGQRAGINLRHVKPQEVARGDALATIGMLTASTLLDAKVTVLDSHARKLQHGESVRLLFGTMDVVARIRILTGANIEPGQSGLLQLVTLHPIAVITGEPFILRSDSPAITIGGGRFLDTASRRVRRSNAAALERLAILAGGAGDAVMLEHVKAAGYNGIEATALGTRLGLSASRVIAAAVNNSAISVHEQVIYYRPFLETLGSMLQTAIEQYHQQYPLRSGAPLAYCRASLPSPLGESTFRIVLHALIGAARVETIRGTVRLTGFNPLMSLSDEDRKLAGLLEAGVREGGVTPPDIADLIHGDARKEAMFYMLVEQGRLVQLEGEQPGRKIVFHRDIIREIDRRLSDAYPPPAQFSISEARILLGSTRKFMVPLLEYFDKAGYTRRYGDKRVVIELADRRR